MRWIFLIIIICTVCQNDSLNIDPFKNLFNTGKNITMGVVSKLPDGIPAPWTVFDAAKQTLAGYPLVAITTALNEICSSVNSAMAITSQITPDIKKMAFLLMTPCKNYSYPLLEADEMWHSEAFDIHKKVVILATGWTTNINETGTIYAIGKAYLCRGDVNFIAIDVDSYVDTLYTWSALNTEEIGLNVAKGLVELSKIVPVENIHLIGHSLGAHIVGAAARNFYYETGQLISRITGLDPAKPCFKEGESLSGLQRGDAEFIDVIHSNSGILGKRDPTGDIDFYPGGLGPLTPGCYTPMCAHARAWQYYAETVYPGNEKNFMGIRCGSLSSLHNNKCPGKEFPMGFAVPKNIKGNLFLDVNTESPYGVNGKPLTEQQQLCGYCPTDSDNIKI